MNPALALMLAPIVVPSGDGMPAEQKVEILAQSAVTSAYTQLELFEDASVRAEMERVGLDQGCPLARQAVRDTVAERQDQLIPLARAAVLATIPAERLEALRPVSLSIGLGGSYRGRVMARLTGLAGEQISEIHREVVSQTLARLRALPTHRASPDEKPLLPAVIQSGFGADPAQTFERAPLLSLACLMRSPPPGNLRIDSGGETWPEPEPPR